MLSTAKHLPGGHSQGMWGRSHAAWHQHLQRGGADKRKLLHKGKLLLRAQQLQHGHLAGRRGQSRQTATGIVVRSMQHQFEWRHIKCNSFGRRRGIADEAVQLLRAC